MSIPHSRYFVAGGLVALTAVVLMAAGVSPIPLQIQNAGTPLGAVTTLNCTASTTCTVSNGVATITSATGAGGGGGGGGYATIQATGTPLTQRTTLNFTGNGIACADDSGNTRTNCTVGSTIGAVSGGSASSIQFNAGGGSFGGLTYAQSDGNGYLNLPSAPISPSPASGVTLFARTRATRSLLTWNTPSGVDQFAQPALWSNGWGLTTFTLGTAATGKSDQGWISAFVGTAAVTTLGTGSMASSTKRATLSTGTTSGATAGVYVTSTQFWRGNAAGLGGFFCQLRWTNHVALSTSKMFAGLSTDIAAPSGTRALTAVTSSLFASWDTGSTTAFLCGNDASGTSTCVDCGSNFLKASTTSTYALSIFSAPSSTTAGLELKLLDNPSIGSCSTTISAVADLPPNNVFLAPRIWGANGSAANFGVSPILMYCEADN
jgi:hypothetical protein